MQRARGLRERRARGLEPRPPVLERLLGALELGAPARALLGVGEHRGDGAAVLALQPVEQREPLLDLVEAPGRGIDPLAVAAQLPGEVVGLDRERLGALGKGVEGRVDALQRGEGGRGGGQRGGGSAGGPGVAAGGGPGVAGLAAVAAGGGPGVAGLVGRIPFERGEAAGDRAAQPFEVPQPLALGGQLGLLGLGRRGALDLLELPHQQVELAVARARARLQLRQRRLRRARLGVRRRAGRAPRRLVAAAEAVEDVELGRGERELAVLVLAVERQQRAADVAQIGRRGAPAAQVRPRAPLGGHPPREHHLVGVGRQTVFQDRAQIGRQREHALDVRLLRPRPDDPRPRLAAQQQVERVREHRLARARLAGQRVQPRAEPQLGPLDQQEVLDAELVEHGRDGLPAARDGPARIAGICDEAARIQRSTVPNVVRSSSPSGPCWRISRRFPTADHDPHHRPQRPVRPGCEAQRLRQPEAGSTSVTARWRSHSRNLARSAGRE